MLRLNLSLSLRILFIVGAIAACVPPNTSLGQRRYSVDKIDAKLQEERAIKKMHGNVSKVLSGSIPMGTGKALLDGYYDGYFLPALTDVGRGDKLGALRLELQRDLANYRSTEARAYLLKKVYDKALSIAGGRKYDPKARFNALLLLGDLNEREAQLRGGNPTPPLPWGKVFSQLYKIQQHPKSPDILKIGALIGMTRHVHLRSLPNRVKPLNDQQKAAIGKSVIVLLVMGDVPKGRDPGAHDWMRRLSATILGLLGQSGKGDAVTKQLVEILLDEGASLSLRCECAAAVGRLDLTGSSMDANLLAKSLGKVAADCASSEVKIMTEQAMSTAGGGEYGGGRRPGRPYGGDAGFGGEDLDDDEIEFDEVTVDTRRRLISRLDKVRVGLAGDGKNVKGILGTLSGAEKVVAAILQDVDKLLAAAKDPSDFRKLGRELKSSGVELAQKVADVVRKPEAAAPPTEEAPAAG